MRHQRKLNRRINTLERKMTRQMNDLKREVIRAVEVLLDEDRGEAYSHVIAVARNIAARTLDA